MKQYLILLTMILSFTYGCTQADESNRAKVVLCEKEQSYKVSSAMINDVDEIISQRPDIDESYYLELDPIVKLILDDTSYAIEDDEIILMHENGTKIWKSTGIRKKLLKAKQTKI